jgi:hypothetical protein
MPSYGDFSRASVATCCAGAGRGIAWIGIKCNGTGNSVKHYFNYSLMSRITKSTKHEALINNKI